jgi:very-short-patch-repair endonuclease
MQVETAQRMEAALLRALLGCSRGLNVALRPAGAAKWSPIEVDMVFALIRLSGGFVKVILPCGTVALAIGTTGYTIEPQFSVGRRRVDFKVSCGDSAVFVECDGHEWHEKTKLQAARDKQRSREILRATDVPTMRFTGSEIHRNAEKCAGEVFAYLESTTAVA